MTFWQPANSPGHCYAQLFRSGAIETVDGFTLTVTEQSIPSVAYEEELIRATDSYLKLFLQLAVEPPIAVMLSMIGVKGFTLATGQPYSLRRRVPLIDRDVLLLPETVLEDLGQKPASLLRPLFDTVWQSAGFTRSFNYNDAGKWAPRH
jgi:hypothetical protein